MQSIDRAVMLLHAVAEASGATATVAELAATCELNRATAWRMLSTLETHGMVSVDRSTGRWSIGNTIADIARAAGLDRLIAIAHPILVRVSGWSGETADLSTMRGGSLTYVDEVRPRTILSAQWLGRTVPLHATSTGKALLAALSVRELDRLLPDRLEAFTSTTITDRVALDEELALTRERGFATCRGELESHLHGVSAAILQIGAGRPLGVVSIWGPDVRVTSDRLAVLGAAAAEAAGEIAAHGDEFD